MATRFPIVNPIRFQSISELIDYSNNMPRFDLMRLGEDYQKGIYANKNIIADFALNTQFSFLIQTNLADFNAEIFLPNNTSTIMSKQKITPGAYSGDDYYRFIFTPILEGEYRIVVSNNDFAFNSDSFYVNNISNNKDLIEIVFFDTQNRINGYWFNETSQVWSPKAYYTGFITPQQPENELTLYEDEGGVVQKIRSVPKRVAELVITDIHFTYVDVINYQLQCDNVLINGVYYTAQDISIESKEKSDLINVTAKLTQSEEENGYLLT